MSSGPEKPVAGRPRISAAQLWIRIAVAIVASALLAGVLYWERRQAENRWSSLLAGSPRAGAKVFEAKGCASCHSAVGVAQGRAPDLASESMSRSRPDELVTVMWNHAPQMWKRMREARAHYPSFSQREMANLLAYLYMIRYVGESGDLSKGQKLFRAKGCIDCHAVSAEEESAGKNRTVLSSTMTAVGLATAMWNHPAIGESDERHELHGREMNDIVSYVRGGGMAQRVDQRLLYADFARGWKVFREKSCVACHSVKDEAGHIGPELGPGHELPPTVLQLAGSIWNHSPAMWRAMEHLRIERPSFKESEMADLVAFLYSFRYVEPGGSSKLGEVLFVSRGCSRCHGARALGTRQAPGLRGRGKSFSSVAMATALWSHGPAMYRRAEDLGLSWPHLAENDVGNLIAFLNTSPEEQR